MLLEPANNPLPEVDDLLRGPEPVVMTGFPVAGQGHLSAQAGQTVIHCPRLLGEPGIVLTVNQQQRSDCFVEGEDGGVPYVSVWVIPKRAAHEARLNICLVGGACRPAAQVEFWEVTVALATDRRSEPLRPRDQDVDGIPAAAVTEYPQPLPIDPA